MAVGRTKTTIDSCALLVVRLMKLAIGSAALIAVNFLQETTSPSFSPYAKNSLHD